MARIKKQLTELIGGTPLLELSRFSKKQGAKAQVIAKLEYFNPGGSVKDRIALAMIEDAQSPAHPPALLCRSRSARHSRKCWSAGF